MTSVAPEPPPTGARRRRARERPPSLPLPVLKRETPPDAEEPFPLGRPSAERERWVLAESNRHDLGPPARLVLWRLASHGFKHGEAFPSRNTLTRETGLAPRTVYNALRELVGAGVVTEHRRPAAGGRRRSNLYRFRGCAPRMAEPPAASPPRAPAVASDAEAETVAWLEEQISYGEFRMWRTAVEALPAPVREGARLQAMIARLEAAEASAGEEPAPKRRATGGRA